MAEASRPTLQDLLNGVIGQRLEGITFRDHDRRDQATPLLEVVLCFENARTLHFWVDEVEGWTEAEGATVHIEALHPRPPRQIED